MSPDHAGAGFPRRCEIRPGTAREPGWLEDTLARLEAVCGGTAPKPTLVMDAGMASAENILWLGERGYDWIAPSVGAALERLHSGLPVKGRIKRYDRVLESIGRLKQRFPAVARPYEITLETADTGANPSAVRFKRRPQYDEAVRAPAPMGCAPATSTGISRRSCGPTGVSPTSRPPSAA